ncbi:peptide chain release factor N(5)-glutamine methyltransferase [Radiobacillus sp. PE A8.2]|uniref:peptide chain release factor N(5)-glutamine methyltransferase n=1 Tax=Radiobacillus sp. PE A8.2 TaxID=3380349 RepID=UPI00389004CA
MRIHEALAWASSFLENHKRESRVGELLLLHHLDMTKSQLISSMREQISAEQQRAFEHDVMAHATTGIPVQHQIGSESFYGRDFVVNKNVLIPRPETEELVQAVLDYIDQMDSEQQLRIVDVGTGSGIISTTIKLECSSVDMWATDISPAALLVAKQNAEHLGARITFVQGDFLQPLLTKDKQFDVIVSNPPYIAFSEKDSLQDTVKNYDPALALFADSNGLAAYQAILSQAKNVVADQALLAFEIGYQQGGQVRELIQQYFPRSEVEVRKDINGKDRMVFATISAV